jgi:hypothetical protein
MFVLLTVPTVSMPGAVPAPGILSETSVSRLSCFEHGQLPCRALLVNTPHASSRDMRARNIRIEADLSIIASTPAESARRARCC